MNNLTKIFRYVNESGADLIFTPENGYIINKPMGIDTVSVNLSQEVGIGQVGSTVQASNVNQRPVTVNGKIYGEQAGRKDELLAIVRPDLKGRFYADDYYLDVRPTSTPTIGYHPCFAPFQFSLLAPYPYWQKDAQKTEALSGLQYHFKFPWKIKTAWKFAEAMEMAYINVMNRGQLPVPYTVTFVAKGDVTNPKITNVLTGKSLLVNKTMSTGERIVVAIGHDRTTVTSTAEGDIGGALSLSTTLYRLDVGDNPIKPEAASGMSSLDAIIEFSEETVGIAI